MAERLPALILTGASGIVGRSFLKAARDKYRIFAIARRAQSEAGVAYHANIEWIQVDIENAAALAQVTAQIERLGGADFLLHLAAYYDFENQDRPEFRTTNGEGTRNVLAQAKALAVRRFVFASSVAACRIPEAGQPVTEDSPPDADFPYARSKKVGEAMVREHSRDVPCAIVRLAAVFSDWCEYAPLYVFLSTWLSRRWNARLIAGKGLSAVPYVHEQDVSRLFLTIFEQTARLPRCGIYLASPDGATSQVELFELATGFHFRDSAQPIFMPRLLAGPGLIARDWATRLIGRRAFERRWMLEYLDRQLTIDSSRTRRELGWSPRPRFHILRRLLFLIEKMTSDRHEWFRRNEQAMKRLPERPALVIHDAMLEAREAIVDAITAYLRSPDPEDRFPHYSAMPHAELRWYAGIIYDLLAAAVRTADRTLLLGYVHMLAQKRLESGFPESEVCEALLAVSEITVEQLFYRPELTRFVQQVRASIGLSTALAIDGIQDAWEEVDRRDHRRTEEPSDEAELEAIVARLGAFYRPSAARPAIRARERSGQP